MHFELLSLLLPVWSFIIVTAPGVLAEVGQSEFSMGVLLPRQQSRTNLQAFTGALGGATAPGITNSDDPQRPFEVDGDTFVCIPLPCALPCLFLGTPPCKQQLRR
jgi:hypothetical protein